MKFISCSLICLLPLYLVSQDYLFNTNDHQSLDNVVNIDSLFYVISTININGKFCGSTIQKIDKNKELEFINSISDLNDSFFCERVVYFWKNQNKFILHGFGRNKITNNNYILFFESNLQFEEIRILERIEINDWKESNLINKPLLNCDFNKVFLFQDKVDNNYNIHKISNYFEGFDDEIYKFSIRSNLYDYSCVNSENEIISINDSIFILNKGKISTSKVQRILVDETTYRYPELKFVTTKNLENINTLSLIRFINDNNYNSLYEISYNLLNNNLESISKIITTNEDSYVFQKISKTNYTYFIYCNSVVNGFDSNYGATILKYSPDGDFIQKIFIPFEFPFVLYDIDIKDDGTIAGVGRNFKTQDSWYFILGPNNKFIVSTKLEPPLSSEFNIYPNPANDMLYLDTNNQAFDKVRLFDIRGVLLKEQKFETTIDISNFPKAMYILKFIDKNQNALCKKIIVK